MTLPGRTRAPDVVVCRNCVCVRSYSKSIRLALYNNGTASTSCFTIIRGADGASATAGGMTLPPSARLHVQSVWADTVHKYAQLPALQVRELFE